MNPLTRREREILERLCIGMVPKDIAYEIELSPQTVNSYIRGLCRKAMISRPQLIPWAMQQPDAMTRGYRPTAGFTPQLPDSRPALLRPQAPPVRPQFTRQ